MRFNRNLYGTITNLKYTIMKLIKYLLTSLLLLCSMVVHAHDFEVDGIYYNITDAENKTVSVTYGDNKYAGDIVIPESVLHDNVTYCVTSLGAPVNGSDEGVFSGCMDLRSITIPNSVTYIGKFAFWSCYNLSNVTIPNSVTMIDADAFGCCHSLTNIIIPSSVTTVEGNAFHDCKNLSSITFSKNVTKIGSGVLSNCPALESIVVEDGNANYDSRNNCNAIIVTATNTLLVGCKNTNIPESIACIEGGAFSSCIGLTGELVIPKNVTSIGGGAFSDCRNITSVFIHKDITSIGNGAFNGCSSLENIIVEEGNVKYDSRENCNAIIETETNTLIAVSNNIVIPENVKIADRVFRGSGIRNITIPNSITRIDEWMFYNCENLTNVIIGDGVQSIGECAFYMCRNLSSVTLGSGLKHIESNAFYSTDNLKEVTISAIVAPTLGDNVFFDVESYWGPPKMSLNYPANGENYLTWVKYFPYAFDVKETGSGTWQDGQGNWHCDDWTKWYFDGNGCAMAYGDPNGDGVLRVCDGLEKIKRISIEEGFTSIGGLGGLEKLEEVYINSPITTIDPYTFENCTNLKEVVISEGVTTIGSNAFYGCINLKKIIFPETLTSIGDNAFEYCIRLKNVFLPISLTSIGNSSFLGTSIDFIVIPQFVTKIGNNAFGESYYYDDKEDEWYYTETPILVFKSFVAPTMGDFDSTMDICIPAGANSYPSGKFNNIHSFESQKECYIDESYKMYVFGNADGVYQYTSFEYGRNVNDVEQIVFTPDATGYNLITILPRITKVEVLVHKMNDRDIYSIEGSNAIFKHKEDEPNETVLIAGCAATIIPEGTTIIDDYAFYNCEGLTSINIPATLKHIGGSVFDGCTNLKAVHIKDLSHWCSRLNFDSNPLSLAGNLYLNDELITNLVLPSDVTSVTSGVFSGGAGFLSLEIPSNVKSIGSSTFSDCSNLNKITIHNGLTEIGYSAFYNCASLTSIEFPESLTSMGGNAFRGCTALNNIKIPESVVNIGSNTFEGCTKLESAIVNNNAISSKEFLNCTALKSITIGKETTSIDSHAFDGCTALSSLAIDVENTVYDKREDRDAIVETATNKLIYICKNSLVPSTVTAIGGNAFNAFTDMDITIPAFVTSIDDKAFNGVNRTHFLSETPVEIRGNIFGWGAIYVPNGTYETYCNAPVWSEYKDRIVTSEMADKYVEAESTEGMSGVLNVIGLNEVERVVKLKVKGVINSYDITVFRDKMPLLSQLDLSEATVIASSKPFYETYKTGKNSLGGKAFNGLAKLVEVKLPKDLEILGVNAFDGCKNLISVDGSTTGELNVGAYAFKGCAKFKEFVSPEKMSEIGIEAFANCNKLESLVLQNITGSIRSQAFYRCNKLTSCEIASIGGSIEDKAFEECGIKTLNICQVGGNIEEYAFNRCFALEDVKIGTMEGELQDNAFGFCESLKNVEFQKGPLKVGTRVFEFSNNIERFVAGDGLKEIATNAFLAIERVLKYDLWGNSYLEDTSIAREALKVVILPNSVEKIGDEAFRDCTSLSDFEMPGSITSIGTSAFNNCLSLTEVVIPGDAQISANAFYGCSALKEVKILDGSAGIGSSAFSDCSSLETVNIGNGTTSIGSFAFAGCCALKNVTLGNTISSIGESAFGGCQELKQLIFPSELTFIGGSAFANCGFENLKLPPTLTTIANNAFSNCKELVELHIPSAVETIGSQAFSGCSKLNDIYTYTVEPTTITETTFSTFTTATLHVPMTSFWNYYWNIGWSRFNHKLFQDFNKPYDYFYLNNDYYLNGSTGYIEGTPDADMRPGSGLIVESDKDAADDQQNLGDVTIGSDGNGNSGVIIGDENLHIDNLHVKINVKKGRWYFFAFPWDVPFKKISMQKGSDYVFRYYDGEERAKNGNGGWKNVNENHLKAARGYIFQSSGDDVLMIAIEDVKFKKEDKYNDLVTHVSDNINDASWNLMGNPYLSYYDMSAMDYSAPVTVWDGEKYVAIRPGDDDYQFSPYEAFFVQKPEGTASVGFTAEDQMTKTQSETLKAQQVKARLARKVDVQRLLVNLVLEHDSVTDRTRVVFNNRQKMSYETACDAAKFETAGVPQLYTLDDDGVRYAINERPMNDGIVRIGFTASQSGEYTLDVARMDTEVVLYDAEMNVVHDFKNGAYAFYSDKGTFEDRFTLGVPNNETTGVEEVELEQVVEVIEGGIAFSADATVTIYNAAGVAVAKQQGAGTVMLQPGVYVVSVGNKNLKVVVK